MRGGEFVKFVTVSIVISFRVALGGQQPAAPVAPKTKASSQQAYIVENFQTRIDFQADGTSVTQVSAKYRVLSVAGVEQLGLLVFTYNGASEVLKIDYVRVQRPDGAVIETPLASAEDMTAQITRVAPMYTDYRERHVPVKGLAVGDLLEYRTELQVTHPLISGEFWYEYAFSHDHAMKQQELEISVPGEKYVQVNSPDFKPVVTKLRGRTEYLWKIPESSGKAITPLRTGSDFPSVQLTTFRSWKDVGNWWSRLERQAAIPTPDVRAKAAELTRGLKSPTEKLNAIYHYVSTQIRYISISFGIGRYQPHAASDVLNNLYGDCKDKHTLLAALLDAAGLKAYPALVSMTREIDPQVPSPAQFDHVVSVVPDGTRGEKFVWLDTTADVAPAGFLISQLRGKEALVILQGKDPYLVKTPVDPPSKSFQTFEATGRLTGDGTFTGQMRSTLRGDLEVALRILFFLDAQSQWQSLVQRISSLTGFGGTVSNVTAGDPAATDKPFEYSYDYTRKNFGDWANRRIVPALPFLPLANWAETGAEGAKPFQLGSPQTVRLKCSIQLPPGYHPSLPANETLVRSFAEYHATYSFKADTFHADRELIVKQREIPPALRPEYNSFVKAIASDESQYISLGNGSGAGALVAAPEVAQLLNLARQAYLEHDLYGALEDSQRAVKLAPNSAEAWFSVGILRFDLNRRGEGESALRHAIKLNPKDPRAYAALAFFLARNLRRQEAIQVWSSLLKNDPDNVQALSGLGSLLLLQKKYAEALTALESAASENPRSEFVQIQLGHAALGAGKFHEGITALEAAVKLRPVPQILNDAAFYLADYGFDLPEAQGFVERAVREDEAKAAKISLTDLCEDDLTVMNELGAFWDTLGWVYFREGKLAEAKNFLEAAWSLVQRRDIAVHLGQLDEKLGMKRAAIHMYALANACPDSARGDTNPELARLAPDEGKRRAEVERARDELSEMRHVKLGRVLNSDQSAEFWVLFSRGPNIDGVKFASGASQLRPASKLISKVHFRVVFPDDMPLKILRRGILVCEGMLGCDFTLLTPDSVRLH